MTTATFSVQYVAAGESLPTVEPGWFILTHGSHSILDFAIRAGQRLRYRGANKWACHWNHAAGIVEGGSDPIIVEMLANGADVNPLSKYLGTDFAVVQVNQAPSSVKEAVDYWNWLGANQVRYGYWTILCDALALLTHLPIGGAFKNRPVCSASVAAGLGFYRWRACPETVLPADLAYTFNVRSS